MKRVDELDEWYLREAQGDETPASLSTCALTAQDGWMRAKNGEQVQEVLLREKRIDPEVLLGHTESAQWVSEKDWVYVCDFCCVPAANSYLRFGGVDTVAEIWLNGEMLAENDDMYVPLLVDTGDRLRERNRLIVRFTSPLRVVRERLAAMPEETRSLMDDISVIRKCTLDFGDFGGVKLTNVGLFEAVTLVSPDLCELGFTDVETTLNDRMNRATISVTPHIQGKTPADATVLLTLCAPEGGVVAQSSTRPGETVALNVTDPALWWPKNYGGQPLYRLRVELYAQGRMLDEEVKGIGIRELEKTGDMRFRVNHREIKLWGGNMVPFQGFTHRWDPERCDETMERIANLNMNLLRIWGGGMQYGDSFYERCDQLGIMVYQDFFLHWAYYPETKEFRDNYVREAEYQVKRLKHHPCILLWSGGNETWMHNEENTYVKHDLGYAPFKEDFASVCARLDPKRYYLTSSPAGGDYPSDPSQGDGHPLYYTYRHSVEKYPVFVSESARTSTGPLRSLKRFMREEEIWPEGYINHVTYPSTKEQREKYLCATEKFFIPLWKKVPVPDTWKKWSAGFFAGESADVEKFYEAHDAESLVYRYNAAYADFMRTYSEGVRRGKPSWDLTGPRRANGYMLWKINDTWPQFYCSLIDFFLETYIPYYQVRRSFAPVLLSFETEDHLLLWGVNDTDRDVRGTVRVLGFSMAYNRVMAQTEIPVLLRAGESRVVTDLDRLCPVIREWVLFAELVDTEGRQVTRSDGFIERERYLMFPDPCLTLHQDGDDLLLTTDRFAHCVELTGSDDGDEFGWLFDDNYFNLLPFEKKRVRVLGRHRRGQITARAHYGEQATMIAYESERQE
ncbi:MAG: hypothetical protein PHI98_05555 [Eubacteriales bacterium]|nr:hypothetical protein [Eubacteriales bacterium]